MLLGAINSPHILKHSGIGGLEELNKVGIDCRKDLPDVGKHLEDHVMLPLKFTGTNYSVNGK
eukprot:Awhi_evm1s5571